VQVFGIKGGSPGDADIRVVDSQGRSHAKLAVSVLPVMTVTCAFHYIKKKRRDGKPPKPEEDYGTQKRNRGAEVDFLEFLNGVWRPQANIEFVPAPGNASEPDVEMTEDLGNTIDTLAKFFTVASPKHRDPNAQFNVFFVRELEMKSNQVGDDTEAATTFTPRGQPADCLFEDDVVFEQKTIAHEAGHCLKLDHDKPIPTTNDMLMHKGTNGRFLPRIHVETARSNVLS
jgi:hypothetical protein